MSNINIHKYKSPIGELTIGDFNDKICLLDWTYRQLRTQIDQRIQHHFQAEYRNITTDIHRQTISELEEYFNKKRQQFDLPILVAGTDFQKRIWTLLQDIPYGKTTTYKSLSAKYGDEKAIRAVASANGANAISILIPCHRVIGNHGQLVGYAGGLKAKKFLLNIESEIRQLELL